MVPITYKPLTKKGLSSLGRGSRRERDRMEKRNVHQESRQGACQRSRAVSRLAPPPCPLNEKPLSAEKLRDRSPQRPIEWGTGAERDQRRVGHSMTSPYKGASGSARTACYQTDEQVGAPSKKSIPPKVQGQGQGQPQDIRASTETGDNPAGAKREEPQAIQQEGRGSDGHILMAAPHRPDSPLLPLAPGSSQAEATARALYSTHQASGASPSPIRCHRGGAY